MRIIENSSTKLVFQQRRLEPFSLYSCCFNLFLFLFLFPLFGGLTFTATFVLFFFPLSTYFNCIRTEPKIGNCQIVEQHILRTSKKDFPIKTLQGVTVEDIPHTDKNDNVTNIDYKVVIFTSDGKQELFTPSNDKEKKQAIAFKIGSFIGNPGQTELTIKEDYETDILATGIIYFFFITIILFFLCSMFLSFLMNFFNTELDTYSFDKNTSLFSINSKCRLRPKKTINYPILEISNIEVEKSEDSDGGVRYEVKIALNSGKKIKFNNYNDTSEYTMQKEISQIRSFLNLDDDGLKQQNG